ncbi:hypothetical protein ACEN2I_01640 [Flavobacterium sp. W22_SRS_FK3]|uniref:hypothetical protein n=1 Tax=Flavobacterium sp. W22_SRS_FK3 TaxID=3240275 RepID=UPI003F93130C
MPNKENRFQDQNLRVSDFEQEVWVVCPQCAKKAITRVDFETKNADYFALFAVTTKKKTR